MLFYLAIVIIRVVHSYIYPLYQVAILYYFEAIVQPCLRYDNKNTTYLKLFKIGFKDTGRTNRGLLSATYRGWLKPHDQYTMIDGCCKMLTRLKLFT